MTGVNATLLVVLHFKSANELASLKEGQPAEEEARNGSPALHCLVQVCDAIFRQYTDYIFM